MIAEKTTPTADNGRAIASVIRTIVVVIALRHGNHGNDKRHDRNIIRIRSYFPLLAGWSDVFLVQTISISRPNSSIPLAIRKDSKLIPKIGRILAPGTAAKSRIKTTYQQKSRAITNREDLFCAVVKETLIRVALKEFTISE